MGEFRIVRIEQIESITAHRKAALLNLCGGGSDGLEFNAIIRKWLMSCNFARPPYKGHRTLQLTAKGHWWAQAILAYEADKLAAASELEPA